MCSTCLHPNPYTTTLPGKGDKGKVSVLGAAGHFTCSTLIGQLHSLPALSTCPCWLYVQEEAEGGVFVICFSTTTATSSAVGQGSQS